MTRPAVPAVKVPRGARCDFQDGMCGWNASMPHRTVQWKRINGSTPGYKGAKDHTYGNDTGTSSHATV